MKEVTLMREIQIAVSKAGHRVFRNNQGFFLTQDGRKIRTGLVNGSADLVGWLGDGSGRFLAIEVKTDKGRPSKEQINFIQAVNRAGGLGMIVHSVEEALAHLK